MAVSTRVEEQVAHVATAETVAAAVHGVEPVLPLTEWPEYDERRPEELMVLAARPQVLDGGRVFAPAMCRRAGSTYRTLGRVVSPGRLNARGDMW